MLFVLYIEFRKLCENNTSVDYVSSEMVEELYLVHRMSCENIFAFYEAALLRKPCICEDKALWKLALPAALSTR
jgi:hypothetical protein